MPIYPQPQMNGTGVDEILSEITTSVPIFTPMFLLFIFCVVFLLGYRRQSETSGFGDAPLWGTIAGVITSVVALILSTRTGLIDILTLTITIVVTIFFAIAFFASKDRV